MKVSPELVGHMVSIQLARPTYITDYKAHVQTKDNRSLLMGEPMMTDTPKGPGPVVMDVLLGCDVVAVAEDNVTVAMVTPGGHIVNKTIPSAMIVAIDELVAFESDSLPTVTERRRAPAQNGPSKIIF